MPSSRIPRLLEPYTSIGPDESLVLLTSILGASTNWLVIRFICAVLDSPKSQYGSRSAQDRREEDGVTGIPPGDGETAVVLVSWLRDRKFWSTECRRAGGLDIPRLVQQKRFTFVDGLTSLFLPKTETQSEDHSPSQITPSRVTSTPYRTANSITPRGPHISPRQVQGGTTVQESRTTSTTPEDAGQFTLTSPTLEHVQDVISRVINNLKTSPSTPTDASPKKIVLILDSPDFLLAATSLDPNALQSSILHLRSLAHSTVISLAADSPLISSSISDPTISTPLERNHAGFAIGMAHQARFVMSLRLLETGFAKDVSGVIRITVGDRDDYEDEETRGNASGESSELVEKEVLYHVGRDGGVNVFERSEGTGRG
ncbi:hypothetical protein M501DRAFT_1003602 [Patellaria atrata CBS 101060]|uniref:Uncharacterized protein n=1 Tax=Patellaria atrata CBS 101060 TaxID=1346257 RepID=A0A9P4VPQ7_9PEZI|nr:hypothetical protein M501DRAFT_1003602 [Patellaria atrata CBS 101060]